MKEHIKKSGRTVAENDIHIFFFLSVMVLGNLPESFTWTKNSHWQRNWWYLEFLALKFDSKL